MADINKNKRLLDVVLDEVATKQFVELDYSLDLPHKDQHDDADVVSHCLGECHAFEAITGDQITNYLMTNFPEQWKQYIADNDIPQFQG